jgi:integrase
MAHSTVLAKPDKPYPEFPLYAHNTKRWAKKVKGRTVFFGPWDNWQAAFEHYEYAMPYLKQGKTPPPRDEQALSVGDMVNLMLEQRELKLDSGALSKRTWDDYKRTGEFLVKHLGRHTSVESLRSSDFVALRKKLSHLGLVSIGNEITRAKAFFLYAKRNGLVEKEIVFGDSFEKPSKVDLKRERQAKPARLFTVAELQVLYNAADKNLKAFILLGLNGGLGNNDIGLLEPKHIQDGWIVFPRPKTLVDRKFPLWKETAKAIELAKQTKHPELPHVFVTKHGQCWSKDTADSPISKEFRKLVDRCNLHKQGRGFYALRHTFRTLADGCRDRVAIDHVMGHSDDSMGAGYTHGIEVERIQAVVDHVYQAIKPMFKKPAKKKAGAK